MKRLQKDHAETVCHAQQQLHEVWTSKKSLDDDAQRNKRRKGLETSIYKGWQEQQSWHQLNELIGSADGSAFSRFAQVLTLARLVQLANVHMARSIHCRPKRDLEIQMIGRYQANAVRSMQSLSGGESFLGSLAKLALGLSELAGRDGSIVSLFMDDRFGGLDSESLEVALRALENLQTNQNNIGVISHMDLLKERVTCQIQVTRGNGGISML